MNKMESNCDNLTDVTHNVSTEVSQSTGSQEPLVKDPSLENVSDSKATEVFENSPPELFSSTEVSSVVSFDLCSTKLKPKDNIEFDSSDADDHVLRDIKRICDEIVSKSKNDIQPSKETVSCSDFNNVAAESSNVQLDTVNEVNAEYGKLKECHVVLTRIDVKHKASERVWRNNQASGRRQSNRSKFDKRKKKRVTPAVNSGIKKLKKCSVVLKRLNINNSKTIVYTEFDEAFDDSDLNISEEEDSWSAEEECYKNSPTKHNLCCKCKGNFANIQQLFSHVCNYKTSKGFMCEFCDKMFLQRPYLLNHRKQHLKEGMFRCVFCKTKFKSRASYVHHMRSCHPELKIYPCNACEKSFSLKRDLMLHKKSHKKYVCFICLERFSMKQKYKSHMESEHETHIK